MATRRQEDEDSGRDQARERRRGSLRAAPESSDDGPTGTGPRDWPGIAWRAVKAGLSDNVLDLSASLTYYSLLSLFPGLIVTVALLALIGQSGTTRVLVDIASRLVPAAAVTTIRGPIENVIASRGTSQTLLSIGIVIAIVSASGYIGDFMWAANRVHDVQGRSFLKKLPRQIILALLLLVAMGLIATVVVLSGPIARTIGSAVGLGDQAVLVYDILRWPFLFLVATLLFSVLYHFAPNVRHSRFRFITSGGVFGVVIGLIATFGFTMYVRTLGNYNATYGALAGIVVFLIWLWIFNISLLLGLEFNVEVLRRRRRSERRQGAAGSP